MKLIVKDDKEMRIDKYICENSSLTRSMVQKLIDENQVFVNNKIVNKSYKIKNDDIIEFEIPEPKESKIVAQDLPFDILYDDKDLLLVNKPKHMVVHPGNGNLDNTLVNALLYKVDDLSSIGGIIRPGIVHRLDKDTSGILIIAKNDKSHNELSSMLKNHEIEKTYIALVKGLIEENEGTITFPIARSKTDRKKMAIDINGKKALTNFKVIQRFETSNTTLLKVNIQTGRTHQIRVHMSAIKHPVIGDNTYSNGKNIWNVSGQMLHSYNLKFIHPISKKELDVNAPLPQYFKDILDEQIKLNNIDISKNLFLKELING